MKTKVQGNEYIKQQEMKISDLKSRVRLADSFEESDFK